MKGYFTTSKLSYCICFLFFVFFCFITNLFHFFLLLCSLCPFLFISICSIFKGILFLRPGWFPISPTYDCSLFLSPFFLHISMLISNLFLSPRKRSVVQPRDLHTYFVVVFFRILFHFLSNIFFFTFYFSVYFPFNYTFFNCLFIQQYFLFLSLVYISLQFRNAFQCYFLL